jgi:predicted MFS family arabinose efflux permease
MRARAIATVIGGMTVAVAFGAPLGTLLAGFSTWRAPFAVVAVGAAIVTLGLALRLPRQPAAAVISIAARVGMAVRPAVLVALVSTMFWSMATFVLFVYIAPLLARAGIAGSHISLALLSFGIGSAIGNVFGGVLADRIGPNRSAVVSLAALAVLLSLIATAAWTLVAPMSGYVIVGLMLLWGVAGWSFYPAQSARMTTIGAEAPVIALSLHASALFFGQAVGAALGSGVLTVAPVADLGVIGAVLAAASLAVLALSLRPQRLSRPVELEIPCPEPAE